MKQYIGAKALMCRHGILTIRTYFAVGDFLGKAFSIGKEISVG